MISRYPGLPVLLAWGVVLVVLVLLCADAESRELSVGTRKSIEPGQRRFAAGRAYDDHARLGNHLVTVVAKK